MNVDGKHYRTIWLESPDCVRIIDQALLPHEFAFMDLRTSKEMCEAISRMHLRGAGLIGAAAAWGMYLAVLEHAEKDCFAEAIIREAKALISTRPTAHNLEWAVRQMLAMMGGCRTPRERIDVAQRLAQLITDDDAEFCRRIGQYGLELIREIAKKKSGEPVNILTHCNAGWLAFVDYGTALSPVYAAFNEGIRVHVWVDETRPRNQGASLTTWELGHHGVPHTLIPDNAGGHLMQHGQVDIVFVGSDRTTANGDVANKIGTYLKALAAHDNHIPFYAALPSSTIDWKIGDGVKEIVIEERGAEEVCRMTGWDEVSGKAATIRICPDGTPAANFGFDVTPARLVTGIITEQGISPASRKGLQKLHGRADATR